MAYTASTIPYSTLTCKSSFTQWLRLMFTLLPADELGEQRFDWQTSPLTSPRMREGVDEIEPRGGLRDRWSGLAYQTRTWPA